MWCNPLAKKKKLTQRNSVNTASTMFERNILFSCHFHVFVWNSDVWVHIWKKKIRLSLLRKKWTHASVCRVMDNFWIEILYFERDLTISFFRQGSFLPYFINLNILTNLIVSSFVAAITPQWADFILVCPVFNFNMLHQKETLERTGRQSGISNPIVLITSQF